MIRRMYGALVRLHPRDFRERFGDEMLRVFDDEPSTGERLMLVADAAVSVARQHAFRRPQRAASRVAAKPRRCF